MILCVTEGWTEVVGGGGRGMTNRQKGEKKKLYIGVDRGGMEM